MNKITKTRKICYFKKKCNNHFERFQVEKTNYYSSLRKKIDFFREKLITLHHIMDSNYNLTSHGVSDFTTPRCTVSCIVQVYSNILECVYFDELRSSSQN